MESTFPITKNDENDENYRKHIFKTEKDLKVWEMRRLSIESKIS